MLYGHLATVRVVAEVHGWLPRGSVGVHTQRTPALFTLPPTGRLHTADIVVVIDVLLLSLLTSECDKESWPVSPSRTI